MFDVITIGTATRDVFLRSKYFKKFQDEDLKSIGIEGGLAECFEWGGKVEVDKPVITTGGGAVNAAVTFARQGFKTAVVIRVGSDRPGDGILLELKREKIKILASKDKKLGTGYSTILLSDTGERTVLVYRGAASELSLEEIPKAALKCSWAYIAPGDIDFNVVKSLTDELYKNKVRIAFDFSNHYLKMGRSKLLPLMQKSALIKGNREEIGLLMNIDPRAEEKLFREFDRVVHGIAIMSDGPRGVVVSDGSYLYRAGTYKEKKVIDRTGAGDAFGSGFVAGLMRHSRRISQATLGKSETSLFSPEMIEYAIRLGSANATSVVEYVGANIGILTEQKFNDVRWKKLTVRREKL